MAQPRRLERSSDACATETTLATSVLGEDANVLATEVVIAKGVVSSVVMARHSREAKAWRCGAVRHSREAKAVVARRARGSSGEESKWRQRRRGGRRVAGAAAAVRRARGGSGMEADARAAAAVRRGGAAASMTVKRRGFDGGFDGEWMGRQRGGFEGRLWCNKEKWTPLPRVQ
ncbi:hypothetical protein Syun_029526 [Stephania yunnanensis]|uniref:Uncharacterized protein n=1 Tax=Stephania yunnanensis TaxID=152371 RepID=A0AAP0HJK1_9MAGN